MLIDDILNVLKFQQRLLYAHLSNHRYNSRTQISAVIWQTVLEHIVADAFHSKKNSKEPICVPERGSTIVVNGTVEQEM